MEPAMPFLVAPEEISKFLPGVLRREAPCGRCRWVGAGRTNSGVPSWLSVNAGGAVGHPLPCQTH